MRVLRPIKLLLVGAGTLFVFVLVLSVAGYLLAPNFYLTRTIFWRESDYKDLERFPARTIHNEAPTSRLAALPADNPYASQIEAIGRDVNNGSLEGYLQESGTTAFLVIHDNELFQRLRRDLHTDLLLDGQVVCLSAGGHRH